MPGAEPASDEATGGGEYQGLAPGGERADASGGQGAFRAIDAIYVYVY